MNKKSITTYIFLFVVLVFTAVSCKSKDCGCPGLSSNQEITSGIS